MTVAKYFVGLLSLGKELEYYHDFHVECLKDAVKLQKLMENERIYNFLAGHQPEFESNQGSSASKRPFLVTTGGVCVCTTKREQKECDGQSNYFR